MTRTLPRVTVHDMATDDQIEAFVLQEFRLHAADATGNAARIVASFSVGIEPPVPLLTSIDDHRDVAIVRGLHAGEETETDSRQRAALDPLVASWQPVKQYGPRITERSASPPTHYRLAVTESGINNAEPEPAEPIPRGSGEGGGTLTPLGLLWIGRPLGTYAGLLTLVGSHDRGAGSTKPLEWPLPLSRSLGIRIYESQ